MRKFALLIGALAVTGLAAACDSATAVPAPGVTTSPTTPAPATTSPTTTSPAVTSPVAEPTKKPVADPAKMVTACPNAGQSAIVQADVTADVTGDGVPDRVIARSCTALTSYWPSTVEVFDGAGDDRIATLLGDVGPTDLPWVTRVTVAGRTITIAASGVSQHGTQACADLGLTYTYRYAGGGLRRTGRDAVNAGHCLPVG